MIEPQQEQQRSSVKISEDAKGVAHPEVKIYDGATADDVERIRCLAVAAVLATRRELQP